MTYCSRDSRPGSSLRGAILPATLALWALICPGCAVHTVQKGPALAAKARWVQLPLLNHSQTPQAGERAEAILQTLLRAQGVARLEEAPPERQNGHLPQLSERLRLDAAVAWARKNNFRYGVTGSVEEWRYRGLDGQPAAGLTVRIIDLRSRRVVFSATGARSGWGRDTVSGVAQELLEALTGHMKLRR